MRRVHVVELPAGAGRMEVAAFFADSRETAAAWIGEHAGDHLPGGRTRLVGQHLVQLDEQRDAAVEAHLAE